MSLINITICHRHLYAFFQGLLMARSDDSRVRRAGQEWVAMGVATGIDETER